MATDEDTVDTVGSSKDGTEANQSAAILNSENGKMDQESRFQEERDAVPDDREKISRGDVYWSRDHATSNAMQSSDGRLLLTVCDAGFQYLLAGTRCSVGVKAGRYFFEVKVVEMLNPAEAQRPTVRTPLPRQLLRLGISTKPNLLLLDDSDEAAYFDSEGYFVCGSTRIRASAQFSRDHVVGLLINVDPSSANANTVSLFRDGVRVADPQRLPESLVGKVLYPCITWKNVTLQINLGPEPKKPLPFTCRMLNDAAAADLEVTQAVKRDKFEVVFPVGLPDQGLFDWTDGFLEENNHYVELSDRQVVAWAVKSGALPRGSQQCSIDKPGMDFGIPLLDDMNVHKTLASLAPAMKRDIVFMELRANLVAAERKASLAKFPRSRFKRVAIVAMGEPPAAFKAKVHERMLADKLKVSRNDGEETDAKRRKLDGETDCKEGEQSAELTDEEKHMWYYKRQIPDLSQEVLAKDLAAFSLPAQDEGFDEIRYVWQNEDISRKHMRTWILDLKKTLKAEHLEPSIWFKEQFTSWCKFLTDLRRKQNDVKQKRKGALSEKAEGEDGVDEAVLADADIKRQRDADEAYDTDTVENIDDIGNGRPLFAHFEYEDWVLLGLRFEFHLLVHAFKKDLDDADRPSFPEAHLSYYYNKYYKKNLNLNLYKLKAVSELIALVKDTISISSDTGFLEAVYCDDVALDRFVRLTEECRRERQRCIDAGDETATLEFSKPPPASPPPSKGDDKGRAPPSTTASRGPVLHGGEPRGSVGRSVYPQQGGGKGAAPARSSYPPAPARGSYGAPPNQKRPMPSVPPTTAYSSKLPRYGTGAGAVGPSSVPRSTYPPPQGGRRYH